MYNPYNWLILWFSQVARPELVCSGIPAATPFAQQASVELVTLVAKRLDLRSAQRCATVGDGKSPLLIGKPSISLGNFP